MNFAASVPVLISKQPIQLAPPSFTQIWLLQHTVLPGTGVSGRRLSVDLRRQYGPTSIDRPTLRCASSDVKLTVLSTGVLRLLDHVCGTGCQFIYGSVTVVTVLNCLNGCWRPICLVLGTAALCEALVRSVVYKSSYLLTYLLTAYHAQSRSVKPTSTNPELSCSHCCRVSKVFSHYLCSQVSSLAKINERIDSCLSQSPHNKPALLYLRFDLCSDIPQHSILICRHHL